MRQRWMQRAAVVGFGFQKGANVARWPHSLLRDVREGMAATSNTRAKSRLASTANCSCDSRLMSPAPKLAITRVCGTVAARHFTNRKFRPYRTKRAA